MIQYQNWYGKQLDIIWTTKKRNNENASSLLGALFSFITAILRALHSSKALFFYVLR